jgi:hypothetical protein
MSQFRFDSPKIFATKHTTQDPELLPSLLNWNPDAAAARRLCKGSISLAMSHAATVAAAAEGAMCGRHPRAIRRYGSYSLGMRFI